MLVLVASTADRLVSVARSHCLGARAVSSLTSFIISCVSTLACERHGDADCRPEEDTLGSTPNGSALNTTGTSPCIMRWPDLEGRYPTSRDVPEGASSRHPRKHPAQRCFLLKGTKLHFKSPMAERRHVLCIGVGGDRTHASRPVGAGYARLSPTRLGGTGSADVPRRARKLPAQ